MADQLLDQLRDALEGQIDFQGQRLAELLTTVLLGATGVLAFLVGYFTQDIILSLYVGLLGTALTFVAVVPPWPVYKRHPEGWLPPFGAGGGRGVEVRVEVDGVGRKVG